MLQAHKGEIPFFYWLMPLLAGIIAALSFHLPQLLNAVLLTGASSAIIFIVLNLFYNKLRGQQYSWAGSVLMHIILICSGWLLVHFHDDQHHKNYFARYKAQYLTLQVISEPRQKGIYTRFTANVQQVLISGMHTATQGKILVTLVADSNAHVANYGDELVVPASYKTIDSPFNPGEFNYKKYLANQNIYHQLFLNHDDCRLTNYNTGNPVITFALSVRQQLITSIKEHIPDVEAAAIASTLLLGYKSDLSSETTQAYSKTGTIHILSVSGAHVAVLFSIIAFLLKPFRHHRYGKLLNASLSLTLLWGYTIITGLSPAACRAAVMLSMLLISKTSTRPVHPLNVLSVAAFAMLLYNPYLLTDVGFQLSFIAVFGLVVVQPIIYALWQPQNTWLNKLWKLCSFSLAAQLVTFPLSVYYFHQFPVYFLISNLLIILPAELIVIAGIAFLASTFVPALAMVTKFTGMVLQYLITSLNAMLMFIEHQPYASIDGVWFSGLEVVFICGVILILIYLLIYQTSRQLFMLLSCVLILCTSLSWKTIHRDTTDTIIFFNLKKNTGLLFKHGNKAVLFTNLKKSDNNFKYSIQPCVDSLGIDSITICKPEQDIQNTFLSKRLNYIQFVNQTIILFNPSLQNAVLPNKISIDYLFYTGNPQSSMTYISKFYNFKHFIVDAGIPLKRQQTLKHEADSMHINIITLRRNKSFVIESNY
ncbi:ComEC/Rec2 family competence protein [uncultured Mucilaginibacter sp.]|uniref:ComEC/Rec2 family competence protein n=1 Tax=uncultured Mucilaginibacter sp. TaxID=797541 RepID=UPI0025FB375B|nr:ComEC/Rec2 family competence protein [uncultured Mucilaginibacter sp.]